LCAHPRGYFALDLRARPLNASTQYIPGGSKIHTASAFSKEAGSDPWPKSPERELADTPLRQQVRHSQLGLLLLAYRKGSQHDGHETRDGRCACQRSSRSETPPHEDEPFESAGAQEGDRGESVFSEGRVEAELIDVARAVTNAVVVESEGVKTLRSKTSTLTCHQLISAGRRAVVPAIQEDNAYPQGAVGGFRQDARQEIA
jgi:hypothetical protein